MRAKNLAFGLCLASALCASTANATCPTWTVLANNTTADATQVQNNFDHILGCFVFSGYVGIGSTNPLGKLHVLSGTQDVLGEQGAAQMIVEGPYISSRANLSVITNDPFATDIGGAIGLGGGYRSSSSDPVNYGLIRGAKENASDANYSGYLSFATASNGATSPIERMRISSSGNVGIRTTSPQRTLDLSTSGQLTFGDDGYSSTGSPGLFWYSDNSSYGIYKTAGSWAGPNYQQLELSFRTGIVIDGGSSYGRSGTILQPNGGNVGIGTTSPDMLLTVNGSADKPSGGSWSTLSDSRLKNVSGPYDKGLADIAKLEPVLFRYKPGNPLGLPSDPMQAGIIAQDARLAFPETVSPSRGGFLAFNMSAIQFAMINAFKELKTKTDKQSTEIARLAKESAALAAGMREQANAIHQLRAQMAVLERKSHVRIARNQPSPGDADGQ